MFDNILAELANSLYHAFLPFYLYQQHQAWIYEWGMRLLISTILISCLWLMYRISHRLLGIVAEKTSIHTKHHRNTNFTLFFIFLTSTILVVLSQFEAPESWMNQAILAITSFVVAFLVWDYLIDFTLKKIKSSKINKSLQLLIRNTITITYTSVIIMLILSQLGINIIGVFGTLGIAGIAVGFAARDTLSNIISGVTILVAQPIKLHDWINIDGLIGRVEDINLRSTMITTRDNAYIHIPNSTIANSRLTNYSEGGPLRVVLKISIAYKEKVSNVREILLPVLYRHPDIQNTETHPSSVALMGLNDSAMEVCVIYWLGVEQLELYYRVQAQLYEQIKAALDQANIEIPFPQLTVHMGSTGD